MTPGFGLNMKTEISKIPQVVLPTETDYIEDLEDPNFEL